MNEDERLLAGISERDPEAFRRLMERFAGPVVNVAYRLLENRPDAEEVAQEVFLRLYQHPPRLDLSARLFTWIYRVTVNRSLDLLRTRRRGPSLVSLESSENPEESEQTLGEKIPAAALNPREQTARSETAFAVRRAVAGLPVPLKIPLLLSTFEELSQTEIAQILQISPKAVERRLARARELLKTRLQPYL